MLTTSLPPEVKLRIEAFIGGRHVWGPISAVSLMASTAGALYKKILSGTRVVWFSYFDSGSFCGKI